MTSWQTILAIDHDPKAVEVYRANFPGVRVECSNVCDFDVRIGADVILGGPPCQPFSHAGSRGGYCDTRDGIPDFIAAIRAGLPRMFLMEQVPGFLTFNGGVYMQCAVEALESAGYVVSVRTLDAADYGVPQHRMRCWFWGIRSDIHDAGVRRHWPERTHMDPALRGSMFDELPAWVTVGQALRLNDDGVYEYRWSDAMLQKHPPANTDEPAPTVQAKYYKGGAEGLITTKQKRTTRTIHEPASTLGGDSRHRLMVRRLTPDECARLQSMPDDFVWPESVAKTHRYRIIGNGWASLMALHMGRALKAADPESETVIDLFCGGGCGAVGWHGRAWNHQTRSEQ